MASTPNEAPAERISDADKRSDAARIRAEILGAAGGTDPFAAAVRATRMPMVVSNPRLPDNPVVFANDAFCRLTGYPRAEILGRNCRFLQGPETDPAAVARIRAAVTEARPIEIDIRNHRRDGEPFWNGCSWPRCTTPTAISPISSPARSMSRWSASAWQGWRR
jgi:PAS domain S-box-containing protein